MSCTNSGLPTKDFIRIICPKLTTPPEILGPKTQTFKLRPEPTWSNMRGAVQPVLTKTFEKRSAGEEKKTLNDGLISQLWLWKKKSKYYFCTYDHIIIAGKLRLSIMVDFIGIPPRRHFQGHVFAISRLSACVCRMFTLNTQGFCFLWIWGGCILDLSLTALRRQKAPFRCVSMWQASPLGKTFSTQLV